MSHTLPPPQGGREGCGAALTHPTAASPLLKGEWMMVMVMMDLHKPDIISSLVIGSKTTKATSAAAPSTKFEPNRSKTTCVMLPEANFFKKSWDFKKAIFV